VAESGLPKFEYLTWYGMVVPAGTPRPVVDVIARDTSRALRAPAFLDRFTQQGLDLLVSSPTDFGRFLDVELQRWDTVVRKAGIKAE
jgi:tripartite-type tricarboxylate transporter receptor subunit TctC